MHWDNVREKASPSEYRSRVREVIRFALSPPVRPGELLSGRIASRQSATVTNRVNKTVQPGRFTRRPAREGTRRRVGRSVVSGPEVPASRSPSC